MHQSFSSGGAEGIRTPGLFDANEARYQLRYSPLRNRTLASGRRAPEIPTSVVVVFYPAEVLAGVGDGVIHVIEDVTARVEFG